MIVKVPPYTAPSSGGVGPVGSVVVVVAGAVVVDVGVVVAEVVVVEVVVAAVVVGVVVSSGSPQLMINKLLTSIIVTRVNNSFLIFSLYLLNLMELFKSEETQIHNLPIIP